MSSSSKLLSQKYKGKDLLTFLIPSLLGILLFMIPISTDDGITIPIAVLSSITSDLIGHFLPLAVTIVLTFAAITTVVVSLCKPAFIMNRPVFRGLLDVPTIWVVGRVLGAIFVILAYLQIGPAFIYSENTGGMILNDLLPTLSIVFFFAGLLLPLLLNFGLLEFCGALLTKIMRPLFTLPGSSSIDCITSWLGDGTVGVLLTSKQYEKGSYTTREACIISTTFSVVSVTFSFMIISTVELAHMFVPFYLTVTLAGVVAAIILPRVWPLKHIPDTYFNGTKQNHTEAIPAGFTPFTFGVDQAVKKASTQKGMKEFFAHGFANVIDMWLGVLPIVMAMGTLALIVAEYTPLFQWLGAPFIPLLNLLGIPEAHAASQALIVGFTDMFLPSLMATTIESEMTRFIIACVSVTQLIYLSEVGSVILGSKIPLKLKDLFIIFLMRTLITLPVIALVAHLLF